MKTIGLIGGMSWESSIEYYRIINREVRSRLGGLHSARLVMYSVDFEEIAELQREHNWDESAARMIDAARALESAGAGLVLICTNTMHLVAPQVEAAAGIPLLHIADATAERVLDAGLTRVGLLGTRFTMEHDFYRTRLAEKFGLDVLTPESADRQIVHRVIYNELCMGCVSDDSREEVKRIIADLAHRGAQGVILGCTELPLLIKPGDVALPIFDTMEIHAVAAVDWALSSQAAPVAACSVLKAGN